MASSARNSSTTPSSPDGWRQMVRTAGPAAALLLPIAFFSSIAQLATIVRALCRGYGGWSRYPPGL
jgi:hypothetical protein